MLQQLGLFFIKARQKIFVWRLEWEIYHRIAPHLNGAHTSPYPFDSTADLERAADQGHLRVTTSLEAIERDAEAMGKAYADAFRYLLYQEMSRRLESYETLLRRRVRPSSCDPRFVATAS